MTKTSMNLEENIACLLCYLGVWITGLIFYLLEKENKNVKFHAMQSILTFLPLFILSAIVQALGWFIPVIWFLGWIFWVLTLVLWIVLMIKAYQGEKFKVPIVGDIAESQV